MAERKKVLITGASGLIGSITIAALADQYEFSGLNRSPVAGIPVRQADITDAEAIKPAFRGIHTVLHLAAATGSLIREWEPTMAVTVQGTVNVYEAAREAGVRRVVFMSSGSTQLGYEFDRSLPYHTLAEGRDEDKPSTWEMVDLSWPDRPDSPYGVGKLFGEKLGRLYADMHGISTIVIRLGAVLKEDRPMLKRHYPGWLSHRDCVSMIQKCIDAPDDLKFDTFNAISNNRWRWRTVEHGRTIGWEPQDSADVHPWPIPAT